ncbi:hypothetical protein PLICRDRAFT_180193 [Plicaturopsis crispa FD-325 SS-3]|uniref:Uncharacterized protein n=1 Tax=Plicaturopsis crispa FD-325 SS-3 TaxID=944288 RepID=A0A0C9SQC1_PLICR|nr:hypothetical protein PLICRDRAFT_180193 [Plicaturopsis crispa FD-325 SS-3]
MATAVEESSATQPTSAEQKLDKILCKFKDDAGEGNEADNPLAFRVRSFLATKLSLTMTDILDRGVNSVVRAPRFSLDADQLKALAGLIRGVQEVIIEICKLLPQRHTYFVVDPHSTLLNTLRATETLAAINLSWDAARRRLDLALRNIEKYETEVRAGTPLASPVSTDPSLYSPLKSNTFSPKAALRSLLLDIPHNRAGLKEDKAARLEKGLPWDEAVPPSPTLMAAFPDRPPEAHPTVWTYDAQGHRSEGRPGRKNSFQAGRDWCLPEMFLELNDPPPRPSRKGKGKARVEIRDPPHDEDSDSDWNRRSPKDRQSSRHIEPPLDPAASVGSNLVTAGPPPVFMGQHTPFKNPEGLFLGPAAGMRDQPPHWAPPPLGRGFMDATTNQFAQQGYGMGNYSVYGPTNLEQLHNPVPLSGLVPASNFSVSHPPTRSRGGAPGDPGGGPPDDDPRRPPMDGHRRQPREPFKPNPKSNGFGGGGGGGDGRDDGIYNGPYHDRRRSEQPARPSVAGRRFYPSIKSEFKPDDVPGWDGNPKTAIRYFFRIQEYAGLGGSIPDWQLGDCMALRLKEDSNVRNWHDLLPPITKEYMHSSYLIFLSVLRQYYQPLL